MGSMWKTDCFCDNLSRYIEDNPCKCDVTFIVGPNKEPIRTLRAVLEVSSLQFKRLLKDTWDPEYEENEEGGIVLADTSPRAFRTFLRLLLSSDISVETLRIYLWTPEDVLNLIGLSRQFGMHQLQNNLNMLARLTFMSNLASFIRSEEFMELSQRNLEIVLSNDEIVMDEVDIFKTALKWSDNQCTRTGIENTPENVRTILGDVLHQIRFPIMGIKDFGKIARSGPLLTDEEQLEVFKFLTLDEDEVDAYDKTNINFNTYKRSMTFGATVSFLKDYKAVNDPPFICDGAQHTHYFQVDHGVKLNSVSFLGPVAADSFYEIQVEIIRYNINYSNDVRGKVEKRMFTRKGQLSHVMFDEPIIIDSTYTNSRDAWKEYFGVRYSIKGPNTQMMFVSNDSNVCNRFRLTSEGVNFFFQWCDNPIAEFSFQKDFKGFSSNK